MMELVEVCIMEMLTFTHFKYGFIPSAYQNIQDQEKQIIILPVIL